MAQYDSARATATRLIAKFGRTITFAPVEDNDPVDPELPWEHNPPVAPTTFSVKAAIVPAMQTNREDLEVKTTDKDAYISAQALEVAGYSNPPSTKDTIVDGGKTYRIVSVEEITPGDQRVLYSLLLRV